MTINTDPAQQRMRAADPASIEDPVPDEIMSANALLDLIDNRSGAMTHEQLSQAQRSAVDPRHLPPRWATAFAAGFAVILIAGITAGVVARGDTTPESTAQEATSAVTQETLMSARDSWNPILATTVARTAPQAATCPAGTDPNTPGPAGKDQPHRGGDGAPAGAFDTHSGRIVYVDTSDETWTFDVCTNTWQALHATGGTRGGLPGGMIYDVDSKVIVALGSGHVSVYDTASNNWTWLPSDFLAPGVNQFAPSGGVYDPVSGLIVTTRVSDDGVEI